MTRDDLLARLEAGSGASRELDQEIAKQLLDWKMWRSKHGYWVFEGNAYWSTTGEGRFSTFGRDHLPRFDPDTGRPNSHYDDEPMLAWDAGLPEWTASLDDVTALADRLYGRAKAQYMLRQAAKLAACDLAVPLAEAVARAMCVEVVRGKMG